MTRFTRTAKRLALPVLLAGTLVLASAVFATAPIADFTFAESDPSPPTGCKTFTFTDTSTDLEDDIQRVDWDFDSNGTVDASGDKGTSVEHTFPSIGAKSVTMTAVDADFDVDGPPPDGPLPGDGVEEDSSTQSVSVSSTAPTADITSFSPNPADPNEEVEFNGSGDDDDGRVVRYEWDFDGDGTFTPDAETGETVTREFTTSGSRPIRFRTVDNCGVTSPVRTNTLVVTDPAPVVAITASPEIALLGQPIALTSTVSDEGGEITLYEWDLNGDGIFGPDEPRGADQTATETSFLTPGRHDIGLRVTDNTSKTTVATKRVWVNFPPEADFTIAPNPPLVGDAVVFRPTGSRDGDGTITRYEWDLDGDGVYEHVGAAPPAHTYATAGSRLVRLRVTDNNGSQDVEIKTVNVGSNMRPEASFRSSPRAPFERDEVTFSSTSEDPDDRLVKHEWDLNDDGRFETQGRVVTGSFKKGKRPVTLRVTDSRGASATARQVIDVRRRPLKNPPDVQSSVSYIPKMWGIALASFTVKVPSKTTISVKCTGRGCPRGTVRKRAKKAKLLRFTTLQGKNLRAGVKISIVFTRPGHITGWDTITIRGNKRRTVLRERCKPAGAKKPMPCRGS